MKILDQTHKLCKIYDIKPARSKGQNFLIREKVYDDIVRAADINKNDVVLEVGPGLGFLTAKLAARAKKVIAVELDDKLAKALRDGLEIGKVDNVEVVNNNILDFVISDWLISDSEGSKKIPITNHQSQITNFKIVANLPYNITSIFLRKFLEADIKPSCMVLMLQKEVAKRIVAKPPDMSILAVSVQFYAIPEIIEYVPASAFWPKPEVDSAIIKMEIRYWGLGIGEHPLIINTGKEFAYKARIDTNPPLHPSQEGIDTNPPFTPPRRGERSSREGIRIEERLFFRLVKHGFSARRKMLKNNLAAGLKIDQNEVEKELGKIGINTKIRAEGLALEEWLKIFGVFRRFML